MCGRFGFAQDQEKIRKRFNLKKISVDLPKQYNIAPHQQVAVILNESPDTLSLCRWGLIPSWSKEENFTYDLINARSETLIQKPMFKGIAQSQRCLILADAFYEWTLMDSGKQPYRIMLKDQEPFAFAGIWDIWERGEKRIVSACIITTSPNSLMQKIHERMPVILRREDETTWLRTMALDLLKPYEASEMKAYPISKAINNPHYQSVELIEPIKLDLE